MGDGHFGPLEMFDFQAEPIQKIEQFRRCGFSKVQSEGFASVVTEQFFVSGHDEFGIPSNTRKEK